MTTRRDFIKQAAAAGVASSMPYAFFAQAQPARPVQPAQNMIWANLLHLSYNMWEDNLPLKYRDDNYHCTTCQEAREWAHGYRPVLTFDEAVWHILLEDMAAAGINMVVIDLGDGVAYDSHPEIAVKNAWSPYKLKKELDNMRKLGLEPIPKLNFATTHSAWMGEYHRMISTKKYYQVCKDLIDEVIHIFDAPRLFHLGMDEENAGHQKKHDYVVVRQNDLWWDDLYFLIAEVEKRNVRPWIWSDYAWKHAGIFFRKMPKSVLQSNWYYDGDVFDPDKLEEPFKTYVKLYYELEANGYDQVPTGSSFCTDKNMEATVDCCKDFIAKSRLLGFMASTWKPTLAPCLDTHKETIRQMGRAIKKYRQ
jgi:hypothetical protein